MYRTQPRAAPPPFALVRTDIAAFVGYAERGPLPEDFSPGFDASDVAIRLTSWDGFVATFGSYRDTGYLACAVRGFFENGGDTCYVVRVAATRAAADRQPRAARFPLPAAAATPIGTLGAIIARNAIPLVAAAADFDTATLAEQVIRIAGTGMVQDVLVQSIQSDGTLLLAAPLDPQLQPGDPISVFSSAAAIVAKSRGAWGNRLRLDFTQLDNDAFGLVVRVDLGPGTLAAEQEAYPRLEPAALAAALATSNLVRLEDGGKTVAPLWFDAAGSLGPRTGYLAGGREGLSDVKPIDLAGAADDRRGLRLIEEIDEVAIVAMPDTVLAIDPVPVRPQPASDPCAPAPPTAPPPPADDTATPPTFTAHEQELLQMRMIEQCERLRYRVALIDPPRGIKPDDMTLWPGATGLVNPSAKFAAVYYPWLGIPDARSPLAVSARFVPPSGHIAGIYAQVDLSVGVQHPPANVAFAGVTDLAEPLTQLQAGALNHACVNALRIMPGRGIRVMGARSLASDPAWRFIHVRRLMSAIEEMVQRQSRWTVFESNTATLRATIAHSLTVLLQDIWRKGGLKGATPREAFYVRCDALNNPPAVVDAGQMVCEVGVAVVAPMELLIFEMRQDVAGGTVVER